MWWAGIAQTVGIATRCGMNGRVIGRQIFCTCPDRPRGPVRLLYDGIYQSQSGPSHMKEDRALEKFSI